MNAWYAINARQLLDQRKAGVTPEHVVVVSLIDRPYNPFELFVKADMPGERMDWRMLVNLEVWVLADARAALSWVLDTTSRIAHARPKGLTLRFVSPWTHRFNTVDDQFDFKDCKTHDVVIGDSMHVAAAPGHPAYHLFTWFPFAAHPTPLANRLVRALRTKHQPFTTL